MDRKFVENLLEFSVWMTVLGVSAAIIWLSCIWLVLNHRPLTKTTQGGAIAPVTLIRGQ